MELGALCFGFGLLFAWCIFFIYFLVCLVWLGFVSFHCVYREATTMIAICKKGNAFEVYKHTARSCSCSSVCVCVCMCWCASETANARPFSQQDNTFKRADISRLSVPLHFPWPAKAAPFATNTPDVEADGEASG